MSAAEATVEEDAGAPDLGTLGGCAERFFGFIGPKLLLAQIGVALALRPFFGEVSITDALIVVAVVIYWPLQEWAMHFKLLHMRPRTIGPFTFDPYFAKSHRYHHRNPWRIETAMLPMRVILTLAPFHVLFWWLVAPSTGAMLTGIAAFTTATLVYEWTHYLTHTPYKPKGRYYRWIRRNHRMHHFRNERYWHSFTAPFLDTAFGTGPDPKDVPRSGTCHDLGVRD